MKNYTFFLILFLCSNCNIFSQKFYQQDSIQDIRITFTQTNWDYLMDTAKMGTEETYLIAKQVVINGVSFDSVGVKYKGNSTYSANNKKNPLHIALDIVKNQDYKGYTDIKLSNIFADPPQVREAVSYDILSHYMHCPKANYAKVYINGAYYGLMTNVEHIGKNFVRDHFGSSEHSFFKCNPVGGAGPGSMGVPNLVFNSYDSSKYKTSYEIRSDYGWKQLISLMDSLKNHIGGIESILDVDRALWMLAFNNVLVNLDSYTGAFAQNYYLYEDDDARFNSIVWDLNMSFGSFSSLGAGGAGGGNLDSTKMKNMDIAIQSTNTQRPLIYYLLSVPTYKKMYLAHIRTITKEMIETGYYETLSKKFQTIIDSAVYLDNNKTVSYQGFKDGLYKAVSGGFGGATVALVNLMRGRLVYYKSNADYNKTPPSITKIEVANKPIINSNVNITAFIFYPTKVFLGYRKDHFSKFNKIEMFDDGLHGDDAVNDGKYGATIFANGNIYEYYIYAENADAGIFSPERAEHEFYSFQTIANLPNPGEIVINEFMADNISKVKDSNDQYEDWIELFNNTDKEIELSGLYLTDDPELSNKWAIPNGTFIGPKSFQIVWADEDKSQTGLHANFKLKKSGEFIGITDGMHIFLDSISFTEQLPDTSLSRFPNGNGPFILMPTTFNALNEFNITGVTNSFSHLSFNLYPNPAKQYANIQLNKVNGEDTQLLLYNQLGQMIYQHAVNPIEVQLHLDLSKFEEGNYLVVLQNKSYRQAKVLTLVH